MFLGVGKQYFPKRHKVSVGGYMEILYFALQSIGIKVKMMHIKQYYSYKYGFYVTLKRIISGNNNEVSTIYPKLENNSSRQTNTWVTT